MLKVEKAERRSREIDEGRGRDWECRERSRNIEANGESLRSLDVAGGTLTEGVGRSRDVECRRWHRRGRRESYRQLNTSISDRHTEGLFWQYIENGSETTSEKLINYRE
jgi:hypothetical protein